MAAMYNITLARHNIILKRNVSVYLNCHLKGKSVDKSHII